VRNLKIILSVLFVLGISFFVVRSCVHKKPVYPKETIALKRVVYKKEPPQAVIPPVTPPAGPRMAIILDDWGNNFSLTKLAVDIQRPLTLSILPHLPQSARIAKAAYQNGLGVMLHMPMQPKHQTKNLERHMILLEMPDPLIIVYLDRALANIPHAAGVNNHMGSAATSDLRVMRTVLKHLSSKGLFFIDSNTSSTTVCPQAAKETGVRFSKRDVFIDNEMNPAAIKNQLKIAQNIALKRGRVIVVGHDRKMTMQVIKEMVPTIEQAGIRFVWVKDLAE